MSKPICPRCNGYIPNNETPGAYMGALSRKDNETYICSACGTDEAILQMQHIDLRTEDWPVPEAVAQRHRSLIGGRPKRVRR